VLKFPGFESVGTETTFIETKYFLLLYHAGVVFNKF